MKPIVYLGGPITGLAYSGATTWREDAKRALEPEIDCANPLRGCGHLIGETKIKHTHIGSPFTTQRGIMLRDHFDVCRADALLVNLIGAPSLSAGTVMEIGWAWDKRKPIVVIMEVSGNPHDGHPMIMEAIDFRCSDPLAGYEMIRSILLLG